MTDEQIIKAQYHAACDIAYRWFAFFEGETEALDQHCALFSEDVILTHAGTHLLAQGKEEIKQWLRNLPYEKGSHFIRNIDVINRADNQADVNMNISYQRIDANQEVGGALSEYRTRVKFDERHNATFTFIQKTPRFPNPDPVFHDSFAVNRLRSFIARFSQLIISDPKGIAELVSAEADQQTTAMIKTLKWDEEIGILKLLSFDPKQSICEFLISSNGMQNTLALTLIESAGRYMTILRATISERSLSKS